MDKVIVITGASAGIGATLAIAAAKQGASVVLAARRKPELDAVAAQCGPNALTVVTDVTIRGDMERLRDAALARFGRIDVWVNNAGRGITRQPSQLTDDDLDSMWRDNVKSVMYGVQAVLPHFRERNAGQIVNVSSGLGRIPFATIRSAYGAAKHALNALTASLRMELRGTHPGIVVSLVIPGVVATDFGLNALGGGPDSRKLPGAQSVDEVAAIMLDVIAHPKAEVYTQPGMQADVERYYHDVAAFEAKLAEQNRR